ncbi:uncharacterized protein [Mycetomoellerius zeteki]|uniref:uncharacterized protein isoform X2 n=1 Tax=Mycetomoellerius zeteki TaxID=64791 RepID=UPI00084E583D|nr:PREDICTED: uncharacterized protein LOC108730879 isoform X2 [Trachymyrmex zeteki]
MVGSSRLSGFSRCGVKTTKSMLFTLEGLKKKWELIPLVLLNACVMLAVPSLIYHRLFITTIDVQLTDYQRYEIPSVPRFYDLRNPRILKFDTRMAQSTDHVFGEQYVGRRERRSMQRESPVCLTIGMRRNMVEKERERRGKTSPYLNLLDSVQRMEAGHSSRQSLQTDETRTDVRC